MSVYNGLPYLKESVESILNQTYRDFYFLIINDGSEDGSSKYLESINDERVTVLHQKNAGLGNALNKGIKLISTKYMARMDADDIALPQRLEKQVKFLDKNPNVGMVGTRFAFTIDGRNRKNGSKLPIKHDEIYKILQNGGHAISHPTICMKTEIVKKIGGYRVPGGGQDWDFFMMFAENSRLANINEVLQLYRIEIKKHEFQTRLNRFKGQEFALFNAQKRSSNKREITFKEFDKIWKNRLFIKNMKTRLKCVSSTKYNYYLNAFLRGKYLKSYYHLFISILAYPPKVINYLKKHFLFK